MIKGLKKIAGMSKKLNARYAGWYLQLNYNKKTREAWADEIFSIGQNHYIVYDDQNVLNCGKICKPMKMAEIAEMIAEKEVYA